MFTKGFAANIAAVAVILGCLAMAGSAAAVCRIDWNGDGEITESDYLQGDPIGGFYAEWYIYQYYPTYYPILFPSGDTTRLDFDGDGTVGELDLMGPLDAVQQTEGFYVEWYIYMFYDIYYGVFMPESTCVSKGVRESVPLTSPTYLDVSGVLFYEVSRNGEFIGAVDYDNGLGFIVPTQDVIDNPTSKATYEYMGTEQVYDIVEFSNDNNIVLARIAMTVDGTDLNGGAWYNRTTGVWSYLPEPEEGVNWAACRFYPKAGGMSMDGRYIGGATATVAAPCRYTAFVYDTVLDEYTLMPHVEAGQTQDVKDCNADGTQMVGYEQRDSVIVDGEILFYGGRVPTMWSKQSDGSWLATRLGEDPPGTAYNITYDGSAWTGTNFQDATIWTDSGSTNLGRIATDYGAAPFGMSDDATFLTGTHPAGLGNVDPFVWRQGHGGLQSFESYMSSKGAPVGPNWNAGRFVPKACSSDGKVIIGAAGGLGTQYGFLAVADPF